MLPRNRATLSGALTAAVLTGVFCAGFASVMHQVAPMVTLVAVILLSATSGFLGSLFASLVMKWRADR